MASAHDLFQTCEGRQPPCDWIHAYLYRQKGYAAYWYRRAEKPIYSGCLAGWSEPLSAPLTPSVRD